MGLQYCTRESVKTALDVAETARSNDQIDAAIQHGARDCERPEVGFLAGYAPVTATRYFDYPSRSNRAPSWRLWLDQHRALSVTSLAVDNGATVIAPADYFLEPANDGPPYNRIEIDLSGPASLSSGSTHQRAVRVTGLWGITAERRAVGTLSGTLAASVSATASMSWNTARFGVGDVLWIDDERMFITERSYVDSGQDLAAGLTASEADTAITGITPTAFAVEELLQVGTETMRIVAIAGTTLTVKRAWDGSQLATHNIGDSIYALTGIELDRAQLGTTLAAHSGSATVYRWIPPAPVATLNRAYALMTLLQERAGWARTIQVSSDTAFELSGRGIAKLESDVRQLYGRKARLRAIV